jgi:hypothetical protein
MDAKSCIAELNRRKGLYPFEPFEVATGAGDRFYVGRRTAFAANKNFVLVIDEADRSHRFRPWEVASIQDISASGANAG